MTREQNCTCGAVPVVELRPALPEYSHLGIEWWQVRCARCSLVAWDHSRAGAVRRWNEWMALRTQRGVGPAKPHPSRVPLVLAAALFVLWAVAELAGLPAWIGQAAVVVAALVTVVQLAREGRK